MVQGIAFLSKKSWHTKTLANQKNVWIAEQKKAAEDSKTRELARQIQQEREQEELDRIAGKKGHVLDRGIDWMYQGQHQKDGNGEPSELEQEDMAKQAEAYLLGKAVTTVVNTQGDFHPGAQDGVHAVVKLNLDPHSAAAPSAASANPAEQSVAERNEAFRQQLEDPMYAVARKEREKKTEAQKQRALVERIMGPIHDDHDDPNNQDDKDDDKDKKQSKADRKREKKERRRREKEAKKRKKHHRRRSRSRSSDEESDDDVSRRGHKKRRTKRDSSSDDDDNDSRGRNRGYHHHRKDTTTNSSSNSKKYHDRDDSKRDDRDRDRRKNNDRDRRRSRSQDDSDDHHDHERKRRSKRRSSRSRSRSRSRSPEERRHHHHRHSRDFEKEERSSHWRNDRHQHHHQQQHQQQHQHHKDNEPKKYAGFGLQGKSTSEKTNYSKQELGPAQELLRKKEKALEEERRRARDRASSRRPLTEEERAKALQDMQATAEERIARGLIKPDRDEETPQLGHAGFLKDLVGEAHGLKGPVKSLAERIHENRNTQQRVHDQSFL